MKSDLLKTFKDLESLNKDDHYNIKHFEAAIIAEILNYCHDHSDDVSVKFFEIEIEDGTFTDEYRILVTYEHLGHHSSIYLEYNENYEKVIRAYEVIGKDCHDDNRSRFIDEVERLNDSHKHPKDIDLYNMIDSIYKDWEEWYIKVYKANRFDQFNPFIG